MSVFFFALWQTPLRAECLPQGASQPIRVSSVIDGDTLRDERGRSYRLSGVNTPELDHRSGQHQPFALEAKQAVQQWLNAAAVLHWSPAADPKDRYGRNLGYLSNGVETLSAHLIRQGLGWAVAIAPNTELAGCLLTLEAEPRRLREGVWSQSPQSAAEVSEGGFQVIEGEVTRVDQVRSDLYIELDDQVALKIPRALLNSSGYSEGALLGRRIEARGWIIDRRQRLSPGSRYQPFLLSVSAREAFWVDSGQN